MICSGNCISIPLDQYPSVRIVMMLLITMCEYIHSLVVNVCVTVAVCVCIFVGERQTALVSVLFRVGVMVVPGPTHCMVFIFACVVGICVFGKGILHVLLRDTYQSMCPFLWITVSSSAQGLFDLRTTCRSSHSFFFYFCRRKIMFIQFIT